MTAVTRPVAYRHGSATLEGVLIADQAIPAEDVVALAAELTEAGADWRIQAFGHAKHAFMAPHANSPELGIQYDARTARRAWSALEDFLAECLAAPPDHG